MTKSKYPSMFKGKGGTRPKTVLQSYRKPPPINLLPKGDKRGYGFIRIGPKLSEEERISKYLLNNPNHSGLLPRLEDDRPRIFFKTEREYAEYLQNWQKEEDNFTIRAGSVLGSLGRALS